ncbi:hypothetical protein [Burkholderia ubonensis]|uniref:hypothetical protein n=1 Tax=Burkholderia ubonensis TaxID=101571 RepID=UPI0012F7A755|nr:hypothetical protein [Burkholderia ubonensis]
MDRSFWYHVIPHHRLYDTKNKGAGREKRAAAHLFGPKEASGDGTRVEPKTKEAVHAQPPSNRRHTPRVVFTLPRFLALSLGLGATGPSAWISIVAGIERSGTAGERFGWAAVALVVLLAAHLLPALTRGDRCGR